MSRTTKQLEALLNDHHVPFARLLPDGETVTGWQLTSLLSPGWRPDNLYLLLHDNGTELALVQSTGRQPHEFIVLGGAYEMPPSIAALEAAALVCHA